MVKVLSFLQEPSARHTKQGGSLALHLQARWKHD